MRHFVSTLISISYQNKLTPLVAQEDCEARRIVKNETQGEAEEGLVDEPGIGQPKEFREEGPVDSENVEGKDLDDDESSEDDSQDGRNNVSNLIWGGKTYAQIRERNIAENKKLLDEIKAKCPIREPEKAPTQKNKRCVSLP